MKIRDHLYQLGNQHISLKASCIDMLENMQTGGGVEASKSQLALAKKLGDCNGEMDVTPEDAALLRSLINRHPNLPPKIQVAMYEAFDPPAAE